MSRILGIDHVAITVADLDATCAFYTALFGSEVVAEYAPGGQTLVRQIAIGGAVLSVHQRGNGVGLVAKRPTSGAADICLRWQGPVDDAVRLLESNDVAIIAGPTARVTADRKPSHSVFFRDPDGNLIELMAADKG